MTKVRSKHFKKKAIGPTKSHSNGAASDPESENETAPRIDEPKGMQKDAKELELERLIFGDPEGFNEALNEDIDEGMYAQDDEDEDEAEGGVSLRLGANGMDFEAMEDNDLFFVDSVPAHAPKHHDLAEVSKKDGDDDDDDAKSEEGWGKPAWEDSDDERLKISLLGKPLLRKLRDSPLDDVISGKEYTRRLRRQYERLNPIPDWALPPAAAAVKEKKPKKRSRRASVSSDSSESSDFMDVDDDVQQHTESLSSLLQSDQRYTATRRVGKIRPETLDIFRLRDANHQAPSKSGIQCLSFHPTHPLLLSGGFDHVLRLYHIDGKNNPPATSLYLQSTPIRSASFHADGKRVFASGRRRFFHIWDLETGAVDKVTRIYGHAQEQRSMEHLKLSPCGRFVALVGSKGTVNILDAGAAQWIAAVKIEGAVADVSWTRDGSTLFVASTSGEVYEWESGERRVSSRWRDEGGVGLTKLSLGGDRDRWCAIGSQSGIVNVYDRQNFSEADPKPIKSLGHLVTATSVLEFAGDGQIMCMASKAKGDALRMVHLPTCTVFKNWPTSGTPLGKVVSAAFAGNSTGLFAAGNEGGKIRLWEIR